MPIHNILKHDKTALDDYTIEQIVAICGDGKLKDETKSSFELRQFLSSRSAERLAMDARYCLENKFDKGGFVLQDVVNEIGRRLGYSVKNGLYQGKSNAIGYDGLWNDGENELLIEVKTSDAYRINLDTLFAYGEKLDAANNAAGKKRHCLIVVGRQDTGDLEAQIRGSRYAWSVRMVSVEALTKLMFVNAEVEDQLLTDKIRKVLLPFEYTRVDHIIDLVFETQKDAEPMQQIDLSSMEGEPTADTQIETAASGLLAPLAELEVKRSQCVDAFFHQNGASYVRKSKTNFLDEEGLVAVTCAVSKRYETDSKAYWFALHPAWLNFIKSAKSGYFLLACMDKSDAFAVPVAVVESLLPKLGTTTKKNGDQYWHIVLAEKDSVVKWNLQKVGEVLDLSDYKISIN